MGDLQCPAVVLLVPSEAAAPTEGGPGLGGRRLSGVFLASSRAVGPSGSGLARRLAEAGGCPLEALADGEGARLREAIEHLADLYRGETVAVVASAAAIAAALAATDAPVAPIAVAIDGSGWLVIDAS